MPGTRFAIVLAALAPWSVGAVDEVSAQSFRSDYSVGVMGLPVGKARLRADFEDDRYAIDFSGSIKGMARLFSDGKASAKSSGSAGEKRLQPVAYDHRIVEDDKTETVRLGFSGNEANEVSAEPPRRHPERYVPVTDADKANVLDPVSALIWPAPGGAGPELCNRTLPLFDGRQRFDLALAYSRTETFDGGERSYSGPAIVCAIRYRPISGHRAGKKSVKFMVENEDMEIWMAPAGDSGFAAPVKLRVRTSFGPLVLEAQRFAID